VVHVTLWRFEGSNQVALATTFRGHLVWHVAHVVSCRYLILSYAVRPFYIVVSVRGISHET
jgi:hypothetical protein